MKTRRHPLLRVAAVAASVLVGAVLALADGVKDGLQSITDDDVESDLKVLTGDECNGRETGQLGLQKACEYVAKRFEAAGLEPLGDDGGYLLHYSLPLDDASDLSSFSATTGQDGAFVATLREDFVPVRNSAEGEVAGKVVFAGYGIRDTKYRWDDYRGLDVRGKVVLVFAREPRADARGRFFAGPEATKGSSLREKAEVAADRGAVGMLVVAPSDDESVRWLGAQYPIYQAHRRKPEPLQVPSAVISKALADRIAGRDVETLRDAIDRARKPDPFECDAEVRYKIALTNHPVRVPNVVARYPGKDPSLMSEYVVVGAHLDHEGMDDLGRVYRGADDNAGGSAALLEVAEAFGRHQPDVARSVVFVAFTGEEKGLLGAAAFVDDPPMPIDDAYAMINMDIISRGRKKEIEATLPNEKSALDKLLKPAVRLSRCGLDVGDGGKQFFQRSDHYEFHKAGVPTVFFNEGRTNEDYHKPTDTMDKVIPSKIARVARLAFALACLAADSDLKRELR